MPSLARRLAYRHLPYRVDRLVVLPAAQPYLEEFGLGYGELLTLVVGPHRAGVPSRRHQVSGRSRVWKPALVHRAEPPRPWGAEVSPEVERWCAARVGQEFVSVGQECQ